MEQQSKQQFREHILSQIPDAIRMLLETGGLQTIRILGDTPNSVLDSADYQESIGAFIATVEAAIRDSSPDAQVRLLAIAIHPRRHSYFVLDVNNTSYDYETAHHDTSPLPVYVLRLSRKPTVFRKMGLDRTLATRITGLHRLHGMDPLPFFDDHNQVLQYCNPRSLHTLSSFQDLRSSSSSDV